MRRWLTVMLLAAGLLFPALAQGATSICVPPSASGVNEYSPSLPGPTCDFTPAAPPHLGSGSGAATPRGSTPPISAATEHQLADAGPVGAGVLSLVTPATGPARGSSGTTRTRGARPGEPGVGALTGPDQPVPDGDVGLLRLEAGDAHVSGACRARRGSLARILRGRYDRLGGPLLGRGRRYSYSGDWTSRRDRPDPITNSLASVARALANPARIAEALAAGVVWTLLLVLATGLMEKTLKTLYGSWNAAVAQPGRIPARVSGFFAYLTGGALLPLAVLLVANVTILGFVAPGFGFNLGSARLWLSMIGADVLGVLVPYVVTAIFAQRALSAPAFARAAPWGLLVCAVGVGASRLLGFVPGLLTGSTVQLDAAGVGVPERVRVQTFRITLTAVIGTACWLATALVDPTGSWPALWLRDLLVAASVVAILSALIELLPFGYLSGGLLFEHARRTWLVLMAAVVAVFVLAILPQPGFVLHVHGATMWWLTAVFVIVIVVAVAILLHRRHVRTTVT